jgi:hypothetical protein
MKKKYIVKWISISGKKREAKFYTMDEAQKFQEKLVFQHGLDAEVQ